MSQGNDAGHEVAAIMKYIAKSIEPQIYLGMHPKDDYLQKAHLMPEMDKPRLLNDDISKRVDYKSIGSDLLNLRTKDSLYQKETLATGYKPEQKGFDYSSCKGLYCQN
ncbi:hypothetical protein HON71_04810 [Candidatus Woesearchaeota archaeon]|jgi:hypothetical protein|nr:hypothetical protein [Candidatus Woesearchaeota archaeon]MBT6774770.1 hypothetical protein [Candidatus Woesearchaeota archaeon]